MTGAAPKEEGYMSSSRKCSFLGGRGLFIMNSVSVFWADSDRLLSHQTVITIADEEPHHFMEFFSPPRVCIPLRREQFRAVHSFDLNTGYNFLHFEDRARAWRLMVEHRPFFTMLSPPCTMYSTMQNANWKKMNPAIKEQRLQEAHCLLDYAMNVASHQIIQDRFFAHEHPYRATSWQRRSVLAVAATRLVQKVNI